MTQSIAENKRLFQIVETVVHETIPQRDPLQNVVLNHVIWSPLPDRLGSVLAFPIYILQAA